MNQTQIKEENMIINVLKGAGISLLMTVILLIIFSLLLTYTNIQENVINPVIIMITAVSILIGSSIGIGKMKKDGLINGAIVGVVYMIVIYLISSILNWEFKLNIQSIIMIGIGIAFGILGGIIGVNRK
ncbi:putative membrane protein TIGR04086 family/integral membrane protein TIGR04097 family [Clostridium sp. CAG:575]|nr:putative membrane protein TIGR04086 family/integral membrane protein TIGR04097 family [Clostridium sp. CAG:575]